VYNTGRLLLKKNLLFTDGERANSSHTTPAMKRRTKEDAPTVAAKRLREDGEEDEKEDASETSRYWLFVAVRDKPAAATTQQEQDEEELGSQDTDEEAKMAQSVIEAIEWGDALKEGVIRDRAAALATVLAMSTHIYDRSAEGAGEIHMADEACEAPPERAASDGNDTKEVVGMLVLRQPLVVTDEQQQPTEITQLFVEPELRGAGAGRALVELAVEFSRDECGANAVECFAVGGSSHFYSKLGFVRKHPADGDSRCEMAYATPDAPETGGNA